MSADGAGFREKGEHLVRGGAGGHVVVFGGTSEQAVAHAAAGEPGGVPGLPEARGDSARGFPVIHAANHAANRLRGNGKFILAGSAPGGMMRAMNPVEVVGLLGALLIGASVGSFLNVCIYRWPLDMAVHRPSRSFCPLCKEPIKSRHNLPVVSWLWLRGRCAACRGAIPARYPLVEAITALGFAGIWWWQPWPQAVALCVLFAICMVVVAVDLEHYIIPDQVTWGGVPVGLVASALVPALHGGGSWWDGLRAALIGGVSGYAALWLVVELGKKLFGSKLMNFDAAVPWKVVENTEAPDLHVGDEVMPWDEIFARASDRLVITTDGKVEINGDDHDCPEVTVFWDRVEWRPDGGEKRALALEDLRSLSGDTTRVLIPREAMGYGDVKFMAMAGTFAGAAGVVFILFAASLLGALFGITAILARRREWSGRIPFGPWLVAGLWIWLWQGRAILDWYLGVSGLAGE